MAQSMPVVLVTGGYDHTIRFWEATSGVCVRKLSFGEPPLASQVNCIAISSDKTLLAAGGNPQIQLFEINNVSASGDEKPLLTYDRHTSNVTTVGFQKDRKWLYSGSEDGTVRLWDPRANVSTRTYDTGVPVNTVALTANEMDLISGDQNGNVKVWDLRTDLCREEHQPVVDVPVRSISVAFDYSIVAVASQKGKVFIYTPGADGKLTLSHDFQAHDEYLLKCVVSPDANTLATTSADKTIKLWNTVTWDLQRTLSQHVRWVWDAVFSADSLYLVSASSDQSAKLWDLRTGEVARHYSAHNLAVTCVALNDSSDH
jgi:G protein beta subunit-like protein